MLTKGAIGNLINRYRAVLTKCNLMNTFGSLAVASMLVMGGAGVAGAAEINANTSAESPNINENIEGSIVTLADVWTTDTSHTVTLKASEDITVTGVGTDGIYSSSQNTKAKLEAGNAITVNGDILLYQDGYSNNATVELKANTITINSGKFGIYSGGNDTEVKLEASEVTVAGPVTAKGADAVINVLGTEKTSTGVVSISGNGGTINISGKNINIDGGDDYGVSVRGGYSGFSKPTTANIGTNNTEHVHIKGHGIISQYKNSGINIYGQKLTLDAIGTYGIYTGNNSEVFTPTAEVNIYSKQTTVNMLNGGYALVAFSKSTLNILGGIETTGGDAIVARGGSSVSVNTSGEGVVKLNGDIVFHSQGENEFISANNNVNVNLATEDSYLKGSIYVSTSGNSTETSEDVGENGYTGMTLDISNGATWEATGDSFVNDLGLDGGNVDVKSGADITADDVSGDGNINFEDTEGQELGSFTAENTDADAELNVQAVDSEGNVKTADEVTAARLAELQQKVKTVGANGEEVVLETTASATDGIVNNGFTTDSEGKIVSGGGASSVTKAVLEIASVNTISLDKILTNDVRKRLGDIRSDKNSTGVWMRWDGGKLKGDSGLTNEFNTIQIGGDTKVGTNCRLGVAGSFTHGDSDFDRGNGDLEGFSFAGYATWMGENGMFADVVARYGYFNTEMHVEGLKDDMNSHVFSLSGEYGWRFNFCQQFFVEPQVELAYTYVSSDDLQLGAAKYEFDSVDSLTGRAGVVLGWNLPNDRGNIYARASVLQQFMGDAKVTGFTNAGATIHETDGEDTWLEYGIGANVKLTDSTYVWADVERTAGADLDEEWRGTVGVRFSF